MIQDTAPDQTSVPAEPGVRAPETPPSPEPAAAPVSAAPAPPIVIPSLLLPKANQARRAKKEKHLARILELAAKKTQINNHDVRELLHVSQSTASNYLAQLVRSGQLRLERRGRAAIYKI